MTTGGHGTDGVERRGLMFVLSSPSGAGKTTLSRMLLEREPGLRLRKGDRVQFMAGRSIHQIDELGTFHPKARVATELSVGAFVFLGDSSTKFGDPAAGASEVFAKAKFTY